MSNVAPSSIGLFSSPLCLLLPFLPHPLPSPSPSSLPPFLSPSFSSSLLPPSLPPSLLTLQTPTIASLSKMLSGHTFTPGLDYGAVLSRLLEEKARTRKPLVALLESQCLPARSASRAPLYINRLWIPETGVLIIDRMPNHIHMVAHNICMMFIHLWSLSCHGDIVMEALQRHDWV